METKALRLWAISDGRAGNEAQALGLAEALARRRAAEIRALRVAPKRWAALLPARAWHLLGARGGGWPFAGYGDAVAKLAPPWPDLAIGAGRRIAPLVAALRRLYGVKAVQILDPRMPPEAFDLVVAPAHDRLGAANAVATLGAVTRITPAGLAAAAARWRDRLAHLPEPRVAVLLGGPGTGGFWREEDADRFVAAIAALSRSGPGVLITPSRRSDPALVAGLRADCDPDTTFLWEGEGDNPYPAMLGLAAAAVVTEDSVTMASEAATAGLPVHVFRISGPSRRVAAFHRALAARGITRDFAGTIGRWSYAPLAEADWAAAEVEARLFAGAGRAGAEP